MRQKACPKCRHEVSTNWRFCPNCGEDVQEHVAADDFFNKPFRELFDKVKYNFKVFDEFFDSHAMQNPRVSGISINVSNINGTPDVKVDTFGDFKKYEPLILKKFGIRKPVHSVKELKMPKNTKEPKTKIRRLADKIVYEIEMPGIKSLDDVKVEKLTNNIEIRAISGDNAYFKLIPVNLGILDYEMRGTTLVLELDPHY